MKGAIAILAIFRVISNYSRAFSSGQDAKLAFFFFFFLGGGGGGGMPNTSDIFFLGGGRGGKQEMPGPRLHSEKK